MNLAHKRWLWLAADGLLIVAIVGSAWGGVKPLVDSYRGKLRGQERELALAKIGEDLDLRYFKKRHYNPAGPDDHTWYGFSPSEFPPGPMREWVSDARWNQIAYRPPNGASYRYGLYTLGQDAWVMVYGDADLDGEPSRMYRHYSNGRLVQQWDFRPHE